MSDEPLAEPFIGIPLGGGRRPGVDMTAAE